MAKGKREADVTRTKRQASRKAAKTRPDSKTAQSKTRGSRSIPDKGSFPIVGIGASAGGLEALELFLRHVPKNCGMAFVVVQHLDPNHKAIIVELLQRASELPVVQVKDRQRVEPDRVYIIPPNKDMSILRGVLHLLTPISPKGPRLPIDFFFRSLADDRRERSVGVVLSGMGSDGTLGLQSIKEKAGAVFVQSPGSAKFDGMPRSAIEAGVADVVASAEELPVRIASFVKHAPAAHKPILGGKTEGSLEKIIILLRAQTGHDFSLYKKNTVYRRIERRMGLHQITRTGEYIRFLQENPGEVQLLFKELLIGVTSFFRDPESWEQLKSEALPEILANHPKGGTLRAWTVGCSTGEEAYSLAIVFREAVEKLKTPRNFSLQIFATDLDKEAIEKARLGFYPSNIAADVCEARLRRYFVKDEQGYRVRKEIREMVIFAPQNLVMDPPFTKLDILTCRNLMIYLTPDVQKKILPLFHYSLNPGGTLFLGNSETIGSFHDLFAPIGGKTRLYRRLHNGIERGALVDFPSFSIFGAEAPAEAPAKESRPAPNLQILADHVLLQRYSPPAVLTNDKGDILYVNGRTGRFLEPPAGKANWNIFAMAREGLRSSFSEAFNRALKQSESVTLAGVRVEGNGESKFIDLTVQKFNEPEALRGSVVFIFRDTAKVVEIKTGGKRQQAQSRAGVEQVKRELRQMQAELQSTREEMQTSQEELRSANEELQSTNEELQSTNEELTTSKEEMQSMNEELQTVNQELQSKVDELTWTSNDMSNLLNSTDIATLFLDDALHVRRFTTQAAKLIKLIPGDVGRPVTDIASNLVYPTIVEDVQEVIQTLVPKEKRAPSNDGRLFTVRIMPYRTQDNKIDGVVITFGDISNTKKLEEALEDKSTILTSLFNHISDPFFFLDSGLEITYANGPGQSLLDGKKEVVGRPFIEFFPDEKKSALKQSCNRVLVSRMPESLSGEFEKDGSREGCKIHMYPQAGGIAVLIQLEEGY